MDEQEEEEEQEGAAAAPAHLMIVVSFGACCLFTKVTKRVMFIRWTTAPLPPPAVVVGWQVNNKNKTAHYYMFIYNYSHHLAL